MCIGHVGSPGMEFRGETCGVIIIAAPFLLKAVEDFSIHAISLA
jgi:hypothetical protein